MAQCLEVHTSFPLISILCWLDEECAAVRPEQSTSQFVSSNSANTENLSSKSRPRLIENEDRLPGAVLLARAKASGEVERGSSFCKQVSAYFDMQFGIFQGWVWTLHEIIIYFMSSIICLCRNCHYTSAQYQDWQPPMLLTVKLRKYWINQSDTIISGLMMDPIFLSGSTFRWTSMCKNWVIVTHLILMEWSETSSTCLQLIILYMMSVI